MPRLAFYVLVVGAGPAGLAAGVAAARKGVKVLVIEKARKPGAKNVMGGVLYTRSVQKVFPNFPEKEVVERPILEESLWYLSREGALKFGVRSPELAAEPANAYTVLRARFDAWAAQQARKAGVLLLPGTRVDDFLWEGERIVGVRTDKPDGEIGAKVVVIAEGVNPILVQKAGLGPDLTPETASLAVKEVLALPPEEIERRFQLPPGQGATIELFGEATAGMLGYAFIYTNRDSLSVGVGCFLSEFVRTKIRPYELLEEFKRHPAVRPLLEGAKVLEYSAHMIPEGGLAHMPRLYGEGVLVAGDAAGLVNAIRREGSNYAFTSGYFAGEVAAEAVQAGDTSARQLARYEEKLRNSFIWKDLKQIRNLFPTIRRHPELLKEYPEWLLEALDEWLRVDGTPMREKIGKIIRSLRIRRKGWRNVAKDMWRLARAIRG